MLLSVVNFKKSKVNIEVGLLVDLLMFAVDCVVSRTVRQLFDSDLVI